jgi:uncharacterized protein YpuA (DUF1002 family)
MTDEQLRAEILNIAAAQNIELTDEQINQIISLVRTLEKMDADEWADKLTQLSKAMETAQKASEDVSSFFSSVGNFFSGVFKSIGDFFSGLFR